MSDANDNAMTLIAQAIEQDATIPTAFFRHGATNFAHTFHALPGGVIFTRIAASATVPEQPIRYVVYGPGWRAIQIWLYNVPYGNVAAGRQLLAAAVKEFIGSPGRSLSFVQKSY